MSLYHNLRGGGRARLMRHSAASFITTLSFCFLSTSSSLRADLVGYWNFDNQRYNDISGQNNVTQCGSTTQGPIFSADVPLTPQISAR
jgi:hypothetical protein